MNARFRLPLILTMVFAVLCLLAFAGGMVASFPLWFRYRSAGLTAARNGAVVAAGLAALGIFAAAALIAVAAALRPAASRWRKLLLVLPAYLLGFTLVGVLLLIAQVGTIGGFTVIWLGAGGMLSILAMFVAIFRLPLSAQAARRVLAALGATAVLSAIAWLALAAALVLVLTGQPSAAGGQGGGQNTQNQQAQGGPPEFEGGPGARNASPLPLVAGVVLMGIFGVAEWATLRRARAAAAATPDTAAPAPADTRREAGQAIFSSVAITIVGLALAQLVPVNRSNPPAQAAIRWDSQGTQQLARRACMDCHSNESVWPWYGYIAPGSWLLSNHISEGRSHLNLSELNRLQGFRATRMAEEIGQQIRNGAMPPSDYLIMHPDARLSDQEKAQLTQGLQQSLANSLP